MKKKVYDYIRSHKHVSAHEIAGVLDLEERIVLRWVNELCDDSYVYMDSPIPLNAHNQNSCYYSADVKRSYEE